MFIVEHSLFTEMSRSSIMYRGKGGGGVDMDGGKGVGGGARRNMSSHNVCNLPHMFDDGVRGGGGGVEEVIPDF